MITNEDLLKEVSQKELLQLSDVNATGEIDQSIIDDCMQDTISFISSFITIPSNPSPLLKDIAVDLTVIELKKRNGFPKEAVKEVQEKCESLLLKMAAKKIPTEVTTSGAKSPVQKKRSFVHNSSKIDLTGF